MFDAATTTLGNSSPRLSGKQWREYSVWIHPLSTDTSQNSNSQNSNSQNSNSQNLIMLLLPTTLKKDLQDKSQEDEDKKQLQQEDEDKNQLDDEDEDEDTI